MKNNIIKTGIVALLSALALTSCEKEVGQALDGIAGTRIAVTAQTSDGALTRTALNGFATTWVAGDRIGVFSPQAEATNVLLTAASSAATSTFGGELYWGTGAHDFYAYYPIVSGSSFSYTAVPVSLPASQTQSAGGNSNHLAALDFMVASPLKSVEAGGAVQFQFGHPFTLLEFRVVGSGRLSAIELTAPAGTRLAFSGGTIDLSQAKPAAGAAYSISGGTANRTVKLSLTAPATLTTDKTTTPALYMMVNPANLSGSEITVTATIDGQPKTITANGFNIARGRKYTLVVDPDKGLEPEDDVLALIPDPVFLAYCQEQMTSWDKNSDGKLSFAEAAAVTYINCSNDVIYDDNSNKWVGQGEMITSLTGIEYFTGLTHLEFFYHQVSSLDVSKNTALTYLGCADNQLSSLDISKNTALGTLWCGHNQLTALDVSKNTALTYLNCDNSQLTDLNVSANTALKSLYCGGNKLTSLDVTKCTALEILEFGVYSGYTNYNQISSIDLSKNTALKSLKCDDNGITSLDLSNNNALTNLYCTYNELTSLDVTKNTALTDLTCFGNQLTALDVTKNTALTYLSCMWNQITSLDLSKNTKLEALWCHTNQLTALDLSKNTALTAMHCSNNQLTSLNLSQNTALTRLYCEGNQLTALDVTKNTALTELHCSGNQLTALDVTKNAALAALGCESNQLTALDISQNTALTTMSCVNNPGDGVSTFPVRAWFGNNAIPAGFTARSWTSNGKTIRVDYYTGDGALTLSADKTSITANGSDAVTFTVKQAGKDVTNQAQICLPSGLCLLGNTFTTTTAGSYEFYATLSSAPESKSNTVTVTALGDTGGSDFDPTKTLHKNVTFFTFTATWCGPCYTYKSYMKELEAEHGENLVALNFYTSDSETQVASTIESTFRSQLYESLTGYPTSYTDLDYIMAGAGDPEYAYSQYLTKPAKTGIRVDSHVVGDKITATVTVGAQEADTYQIGALLIEDNIVAYQNGGGNNYNHTNVLRDNATSNLFGDPLGTMAVGGTLSRQYSFDISANYNRSNLYIVIYTLYKKSNGRWMIANSVKAPINGLTDFQYETGGNNPGGGGGSTLYESSDYSQDGQVTLLQRATEGAGIDIVLMGDGYSDRQIAAGDYAEAMQLAASNLFTEEPYKSFKNRFNVYAVTVVSKNEGYMGETALDGYFGEGTHVGGDDNTCFTYAQKAIAANRMDNALIVVMMNSDEYAGTCWMYSPASPNDWGSGIAVAYFPRGGNTTNFAQLLHHEANGHGFAKLDDEYSNSNATMPADAVAGRRADQTNWGWWKNIDFTNDLSTIRWNYFINDPRYASENLGAYEGGSTFGKGVWRPTYNSIMRGNTGGFNAPSREAIYYRIHKLAYGASWTYSYEEFVEWDLAHRPTSVATRSAGAGTVLKPMPHTPPVVLPYSWNERK